jgi:phage-related minor tail protein
MTDIGKDLSMKVTAPIAAAGAASFKMAADLQDAMGATDQIFKGAADSVKSWADNLESYYGIAEGEALEYANMMGHAGQHRRLN